MTSTLNGVFSDAELFSDAASSNPSSGPAVRALNNLTRGFAQLPVRVS
ncbi:hypothetical protein [Rhodococcus erythropolis]|nr:hypothetical protein [Rhodococcus erythropolis]